MLAPLLLSCTHCESVTDKIKKVRINVERGDSCDPISGYTANKVWLFKTITKFLIVIAFHNYFIFINNIGILSEGSNVSTFRILNVIIIF